MAKTDTTALGGKSAYRAKANQLFVAETDHTPTQMLRYLVVAGAAFAVDFTTLFVLTDVFGVHYLISAVLGFCLGMVVNYILSIRWVFNQRTITSKRLEFLAFGVIGIVGLALLAAIMWFLTGILGIYYLLSKIIATGVVFFWNFLARKFLLFNNKSND
jgi:putative flippase GtrA